MRILVTGGAGYIGSHTLIVLLASGHEVCVVDNFSNSSPDTLDRVRKMCGRPFAAEALDIRDTERLSHVVHEFRPDAVIHFAALKSVPKGQQEPLAYFDVNVGGTVSLLNALDGSACRHVVFSSSAAVYGDQVQAPVSETTDARPSNVYGQSKYMAERVIESWQASLTGPMSATLLRYFNPVGAHVSARPGDTNGQETENLVPLLMHVASGARPVLDVYGTDYPTADGSCIRDFVHIEDLARAHLAALEPAGPATGRVRIFNIGTGRGASVLDVIRTFEKLTGTKIPLNLTSRREGDVAEIYASCDKANKELNWRPNYGLKEMLRHSWRAFEHL